MSKKKIGNGEHTGNVILYSGDIRIIHESQTINIYLGNPDSR